MILTKIKKKKLLNSFRITWTVPTENQQQNPQELTPFLELKFRGS